MEKYNLAKEEAVFDKSGHISKPGLDDVIKNVERRKILDKKILSVSAFGLDIETVIQQVKGSMAIEGMTLSEEDQERIRQTAFAPHKVETVIQGLVKKHSVVRG